VNVELATPSGQSAVWIAARGGHAALVAALLDRGADVDVADSKGTTPLLTAAAAGHLPVVLLLISKGAEINAQDDGGMTALHWAAARGYTNVVRALLDHGASTRVMEKKNGWTPVDLATKCGQSVAAKIIRAVGGGGVVGGLGSSIKGGWQETKTPSVPQNGE